MPTIDELREKKHAIKVEKSKRGSSKPEVENKILYPYCSDCGCMFVDFTVRSNKCFTCGGDLIYINLPMSYNDFVDEERRATERARSSNSRGGVKKRTGTRTLLKNVVIPAGEESWVSGVDEKDKVPF